LSLRPHPVAWIAGIVFPVLLLVAVIVQMVAAHVWIALMQLALGLLLAWQVLPELLLRGRDSPCCLVRRADAPEVLELVYRSGRRGQFIVSPATLVWSRNLLLVLQGQGGESVRLLLGSGNVPPAQLAALRRQWIRTRAGLAGPLA
jgi:hypothetical protein